MSPTGAPLGLCCRWRSVTGPGASCGWWLVGSPGGRSLREGPSAAARRVPGSSATGLHPEPFAYQPSDKPCRPYKPSNQSAPMPIAIARTGRSPAAAPLVTRCRVCRTSQTVTRPSISWLALIGSTVRMALPQSVSPAGSRVAKPARASPTPPLHGKIPIWPSPATVGPRSSTEEPARCDAAICSSALKLLQDNCGFL